MLASKYHDFGLYPAYPCGTLMFGMNTAITLRCHQTWLAGICSSHVGLLPYLVKWPVSDNGITIPEFRNTSDFRLVNHQVIPASHVP